MTSKPFRGILNTTKGERKLLFMYEFEVLLKNGETTFVYGYSEADFRKRAIRKGHADFLDQIEKVLGWKYVD